MEKRQSTRALRQRIQPTRHLSNIDDDNNSSSNSSILIGNHDHDEVIVSIKDGGTGIYPDPDIQVDYSLN